MTTKCLTRADMDIMTTICRPDNSTHPAVGSRLAAIIGLAYYRRVKPLFAESRASGG